MISKDQLERGIASYLDNELMPRVQLEPWKQWAFGTLVSITIKRMDNALQALKANEMVNMLGVIDSAGNIDIDILLEEARRNVPPDGLTVPLPMVGSIKLYQADVDVLRRHIMGG